MTNKHVKVVLALSFITALLISSSFLTVLSATDPPENDYDDQNGDHGYYPGPVYPPEIPDPENMTRRIGHFDGETGYFVSLEGTEDGISNHALRTGREQFLTIFDEIFIEGFGKYKEEEFGYRYVLKGHAADIHVYDNPSISLVLNVGTIGSERLVSFKVGDFEVLQNGNEFVRIGHGDYTGSLISIEHGYSRSEPDIDDGFINFKVTDHTTFVFRLERKGFMDIRLSEFINDNMCQGRIGAEFRLETFQEYYFYMHVSYRDVNLATRMRDEKTLDIMVSSETLGEEGTILLLDISSTAMDISSAEDLKLDFNREKAALVDDYSDLEDSRGPAYMVITGEEGVRILFNVPHFSTHTITIVYIAEVSEHYLGSLLYYVPTAVFSAGIVLLGLMSYNKRVKKGKS